MVRPQSLRDIPERVHGRTTVPETVHGKTTVPETVHGKTTVPERVTDAIVSALRKANDWNNGLQTASLRPAGHSWV